MKINLFRIGLLLILSALFIACENSGMMTDESSVRSYRVDEVQIFTRVDIKAGDSADDHPLDGAPLYSWVFPVDSTTELEFTNGAFVSIAMDSGSVDQAMDITVDLYYYQSRRNMCFEFGPHGYVFQQSIEIATPMYYWNIPGNADDDDLSFFYIVENNPDFPDDDELIPIPTSVDPPLLIGEFEHFSKYAVGTLPGSD